MKSMLNKIRISVVAFLLALTGSAQETAHNIPPADDMHSSGKIYVVVTIMAIIFIGIIGYLVSIDRKVTRIEKRLNK